MAILEAIAPVVQPATPELQATEDSSQTSLAEASERIANPGDQVLVLDDERIAATDAANDYVSALYERAMLARAEAAALAAAAPAPLSRVSRLLQGFRRIKSSIVDMTSSTDTESTPDAVSVVGPKHASTKTHGITPFRAPVLRGSGRHSSSHPYIPRHTTQSAPMQTMARTEHVTHEDGVADTTPAELTDGATISASSEIKEQHGDIGKTTRVTRAIGKATIAAGGLVTAAGAVYGAYQARGDSALMNAEPFANVSWQHVLPSLEKSFGVIDFQAMGEIYARIGVVAAVGVLGLARHLRNNRTNETTFSDDGEQSALSLIDGLLDN
jgi:hypothetical protein